MYLNEEVEKTIQTEFAKIIRKVRNRYIQSWEMPAHKIDDINRSRKANYLEHYFEVSERDIPEVEAALSLGLTNRLTPKYGIEKSEEMQKFWDRLNLRYNRRESLFYEEAYRILSINLTGKEGVLEFAPTVMQFTGILPWVPLSKTKTPWDCIIAIIDDLDYLYDDQGVNEGWWSQRTFGTN